jgi:probable phosphoglycerate mutase
MVCQQQKDNGGEMTLIYLVRHGQTDKIGKILCGNLPGIHLNDVGLKQARDTADYLNKQPITSIYTSPLERACETATALTQISGIEASKQEFLREVNFGDFQGKDSEYLLAHPAWQSFVKKPSAFKFPGGESVIDAQTRISTGLDWISQHHDEDDLVVCFAHCEILLLAVCSCLMLSPDYMLRLTIDPASISLIDWSKEQKKLLFLNYQPYANP